jgi:DNA-binding transcriptional ArsR family regulator
VESVSAPIILARRILVPLPNLWHLFNLRESPYFQRELQPEHVDYPVEELFVGRETEARRMLSEIGGSVSSRQMVEGRSGFGKTSLVQYVKTQAAAAGYLSYPEPVSLAGADTADKLLVRILSYVFDAAASQMSEDLLAAPALQEARRLVFDTRVRDVRVSATLGGFGGGREVTERTEPAPFHSALLLVPPLLRGISAAVRAAGRPGIVVHLNNLENLLSDRDRQEISLVVRDLRDVFLYDGYHFLLVGTPDAVRAVIGPHAQLRGVFGFSLSLRPLTREGFQQLLARRYSHLRLDPGAEVRPPIAHDAAARLYEIFGGDLRGTLRAMNGVAAELIGYIDPPGSPIREPEMMAVLRPVFEAEAHGNLSETLLEYLYRLGELAEGLFTQQQLVELWGIEQPTVSGHLRQLQAHGYVQEERREGKRIWYSLTGPTRILLGRGA